MSRIGKLHVRPQLESLEDRLLLTVFWPDDRTRVSNTTSFPWSAVTRVQSTFRDGYKSQGSGALVGSKHVLTAGHMIYQSNHGGWATSVVVAPGQNGTTKPFGTAYGTQLRTWTGWTQYKNTSSDMGLVTLNKTIGHSTGWFGLKPNGIAAGTGVNTAGYPGDKGGTSMYRAYGPVSYVSGGVAHYKGTLDSYPGQSGSPLWVYNSSTGSRHIVGVHAAQSSNGTYNLGAVLTTAKYNTIVSWVNKDGGFRASSAQSSSASVSRQLVTSGGSAGNSSSTITSMSSQVGASVPTSGLLVSSAATRNRSFDVATGARSADLECKPAKNAVLGRLFAGRWAKGRFFDGDFAHRSVQQKGPASLLDSVFTDHLSWLN